jgi:hypothetical protein
MVHADKYAPDVLSVAFSLKKLLRFQQKSAAPACTGSVF